MSSLSDVSPVFHELSLFERHGKRLRLIERVNAKWQQLAEQLHFPHYTIESINQSCFYQCDSACRSMFTQWLNGKGRKPTTWATLIKALYDADLSSVAQELSEMIDGTSENEPSSKEQHQKKCVVQ